MDSFTHIYNWRVNVIEINEMSPWWNVVMSDSLTCLKSMCVSWWRDGAMEWNTCFNKVQNWEKNVNWKKIYKSFLVESPLIMLLLIKWRLSVLRAAPGAFPLRLEWTWVKTLNVYDFLGYVQPSSVHSSFKYSVYFLSVCLSQWKESNSPLCHIIFNFHQLHPQTVNTPPTTVCGCDRSDPSGLWELQSHWCVYAPVASLVLSGWVEAVSEGFFGWLSPTRPGSAALGVDCSPTPDWENSADFWPFVQHSCQLFACKL